MKIVFRTDASIQIGIGHVMRCLTLADELTRQEHECWFVCRGHCGHLSELVISKGHGLILLPAPMHDQDYNACDNLDDYAVWLGVPWQDDASQTLSVLNKVKPEWLVVDHYALDAKWEHTLTASVSNIMVIDDLANRPHKCSLLLDQNLGRVASDYDELVPSDCQRLIGPQFALLRPEFSQLRKQSLKRRENPELERILISMGGVDRNNVTGEILGALLESNLPADTRLDIVMGAAAPHLDEVQRQASNSKLKATVSVNVTDMAERMLSADLSIGAAGGTAWERCCLGLSAVLVVLAENQVPGAKALETSGAAIVIENTKQIGALLPYILANIVSSCRLNPMSEAAASITNGNGTINVVQALIDAHGNV